MRRAYVETSSCLLFSRLLSCSSAEYRPTKHRQIPNPPCHPTCQRALALMGHHNDLPPPPITRRLEEAHLPGSRHSAPQGNTCFQIELARGLPADKPGGAPKVTPRIGR